MSLQEEFKTVEFAPEELGHLESRDHAGKLADLRFDPQGDSRRKVDAIKTAMAAGADLGPIEVRGASGRRYLHDGHHRWMAAKELGLPVKVRGYYG